MEKKQSFLDFTQFLFFSFAIFFLLGAFGICMGLFPAPGDYSSLVLFGFLIIFLYQSVFFSLAAYGVITNSSFHLLPLFGVHVITLLTGGVIILLPGASDTFSEVDDILSGLEGRLSITMVFSFLVVFITTSTYIMMIFQDSDNSSKTKKKVIPKKTEKPKGTIVQNV